MGAFASDMNFDFEVEQPPTLVETIPPIHDAAFRDVQQTPKSMKRTKTPSELIKG